MQGAGDPVVHDFRVGLRRLMTCLRLGRDYWGRPKVKNLLEGYKKIFDETGLLQDEIVFQQLYFKAFQAIGEELLGREWLGRRENRLEQLKKSTQAVLAPALVSRLFSRTEQLLRAPGKVKKDFKPRKVIKGAFKKELKKLRKLLKTHQRAPFDGKVLHKLRIGSKRIRYGLEEFAFLDSRHPKLLHLSERVQKTMGDWRDRQASIKKLDQQASVPVKVKARLKKELLDQEQDEAEMAAKALKQLAKALE